jgi:hypothetical protein
MKKRKEKTEDITEIPIPNSEENEEDPVKQHIQTIDEEKQMLKKTKPTPMNEPLMDIGRTLGVIQRTSPYTLQIIKEEAARTGRKEHEILRDWIQNYAIIRYDTWNKMSVAELWEAFQILKEMQGAAIKNFSDFAKIMFSTNMQTFTDIIDEATKKQAGTPDEAKQRAMNKIIDAFEPMMMIMGEVMKQRMSQMMGVQMPQSKVKIPVTVTVEGDEQRQPQEQH